jgi:hypothetical protein
MAKLPTTLGERAVPRSRRGMASVRPGIAAEGFGEAARIFSQGAQNLAAGLQDASNNLYRAEQEKQSLALANAKSKFLQDQIGIEASLENDQDWATVGSRYDDRVKKAKDAAALSITDPKYRAAFEADVGVDIARGQATIGSRARAKETDSARAGLNQTISSNMQAALSLPNEDKAGQRRLFDATASAIQAARGSGYITAQEAQQQVEKFQADYALSWIAKLPPAERLTALVPGAPQAPTADIKGQPLLPITTAGAIDSAAKGADAAILKRIAQLESNGNPDAVNPQSGASGAFQFMPGTAAQYGLTDPKDPKASAVAAQKLMNDNRTILRATLGREPTGAELYLAHQQGATGASALLENPDKLAISTLAVVYGSYDKANAAIMQNGGHENMTAGQFASLWMSKFDGRPSVVSAEYEIPAGGYDFTKKTGTFVDHIPVAQRMQMIEATFLDLKRDQDKARVGAQVDVNLSYGDWQRNAELTGAVDPLSSAKIMSAFPNEQGAKLVAGLNEAAETGKLTKVVTAQTLEEDRKLLAAAAMDASKPGAGSAQAADNYRRIAEVVKAKQDALADDPGDYVRQTNPMIGDAWAEAVADPSNKHAFRSAIMFSEAEQKRLGLSDTQVQVMPEDVATAIVNNVMASAAPKDQLDALLQYVDMGNPETSRQVMTELFAVKGGLPEGSALIVDIAVEGENKKLAEKLWTELRSDTSGAKMEKANHQTLDAVLGDGIMEVLSGQAAVTGDFTGVQASQIRATAEQVTKARGLMTGDYDAAARTAVEDLTGQLAMIADDTFAFVYYPSNLENKDPGAMERGLLTLRTDYAGKFPADPYSQATARDIATQAVWVNDQDGLSLIVPGTNRALMHVSYEDALKRGLETDAVQEGQKQWNVPGIRPPEGGVEPMAQP